MSGSKDPYGWIEDYFASGGDQCWDCRFFVNDGETNYAHCQIMDDTAMSGADKADCSDCPALPAEFYPNGK